MPPYAKKEKGRDYCCVDREQESGRDTWIAIKAESFASDAAMQWHGKRKQPLQIQEALLRIDNRRHLCKFACKPTKSSS